MPVTAPAVKVMLPPGHNEVTDGVISATVGNVTTVNEALLPEDGELLQLNEFCIDVTVTFDAPSTVRRPAGITNVPVLLLIVTLTVLPVELFTPLIS
jgi:hypothetical protein